MNHHYALKFNFEDKDYDIVLSYLYELGVNSFEEGESAKDQDGNFYIKNEFSLITIRSADKSELDKIKSELKKLIPTISFEELANQENYLDEWKKFAVPIQITKSITICPSWLAKKVNEDTIILDAAYAFGSGSHETTKLCAEEIEKQKGNKKLLDVGCGSGILSLVAAKLGYSYCKGIDIDTLAVEAAINNAKKNGFNNVEFSDESLEQLTDKFDVVVANILSGVLLDLKDNIIKCLKPDGVLILSGILTNEIETLLEYYKPKKHSFTYLNDWALIVCSDF